MSAEALESLFIRSVCQPAARTGLRLRSERELAQLLGVSRARVAWTIGKLAKAGIVARRTGSGTFLRKIATSNSQGEVIPADQLFTGQSEEIRHSSGAARSLRLGVCWLSLRDLSRTNRMTLDGMITRAQELGHTLTFHSFDAPEREGMDQAMQLLSRHTFDGMLMPAFEYIVDRIDAVSAQLGRAAPPRVFFYTANISDPRFHPSIALDAAAATGIAASIFAQEKLRAGLIGFDAAHLREHPGYVQSWLAAQHRGLSVVSESDITREGRRCALEMLRTRRRCEAIYVADDILMRGVADALEEEGVVPGRDLAVITLANSEDDFSVGRDWSRLVMDPARLGRLAVDLMLEVIARGKAGPVGNIRLDPRWHPGSTHQLTR